MDLTFSGGEQQAFLSDRFAAESKGAGALLAWGDYDVPQGSFTVGDLGLSRLDGIGADLQESTRLYFPAVRQNEHETTSFYLYNVNHDPTDVYLVLKDEQGQILAQVSSEIAPLGTLSGTVEEVFGTGLVLEEGFVELKSALPVQGFQLSAGLDYLSALGAQAPVDSSYQLAGAHFFVDGADSDTQLRLLNVEDAPASVTVRAFSDSAELLAQVTLEIEPDHSSLLKVGDILSRQLALSEPTGGYLLVESGPAKILGSSRFILNDGKAQASLPLVAEGRSETSILQVSQSDRLGLYTGLAVLNPGSETTTVQIEAYSRDGELMAHTRLDLEGGHRASGLLNSSIFFGGDFQQMGGYLRITSTSPVVTSAFLGDLDLHYLSAIEGSR
ncbi:MAG: hypothetical protein ACRD1R_02505 [Acidobacteriota bacterium]